MYRTKHRIRKEEMVAFCYLSHSSCTCACSQIHYCCVAPCPSHSIVILAAPCSTSWPLRNTLKDAFEGLPEDEPCADDEMIVDRQDVEKEPTPQMAVQPPAGNAPPSYADSNNGGGGYHHPPPHHDHYGAPPPQYGGGPPAPPQYGGNAAYRITEVTTVSAERSSRRRLTARGGEQL